MPAVDLDLGGRSDQQLIDKVDSTFWFDKLNGKRLRMQLYQQNWRRKVLPEGMTNVRLYGGYDNCIIPAGCILMPGAYSRWVNVKNDFNDWIEDEDGNPVEPLDKIRMLRRGESIDPADIPALAVRTEKMSIIDFNLEFAETKPKGKTLFKVKPVIKTTNVVSISSAMTRSQYEAMEDNGPFDSTPTRDTKNEKGKVILVSRHKTDRNLDIYEPVIILKGRQTQYEVEGEVLLFRDKRKVVR